VIPPKVAAAVLATEDRRLHDDPALDPEGTVRFAWRMLTSNPDEGGATIEIQLAKLLCTGGRSSLAAYDPHRHLHAALIRPYEVLARLVAVGTLTKTQASRAAAAPLDPAVAFSG
jgi:membrane peptidoglycan carboxypeptidase